MNISVEVEAVANKTLTYLLRDIDRDFWREVKIQAAKEDKKIRDFILISLKHYLEISYKFFK